MFVKILITKINKNFSSLMWSSKIEARGNFISRLSLEKLDASLDRRRTIRSMKRVK